MPVELDNLTVDGEAAPRIVRLTVTGRLEESDFRPLNARIDDLLGTHASLRMLVQLAGFEGWSAGAAWEDARLGLRHFSDFERLAVVGDKYWEEWMTRLASPFTLAEVRYFEPPQMDRAMAWITEASLPHIRISVEEDRRVVRVQPVGQLSAEDFSRLAEEVDPLIDRWGGLNGLVIESLDFPGWESLGALVRHVRFVSDHHRAIRRIALVTRSALGSIAEHVASHFVAARIKQFDPGDLDIALDWASKDDHPPRPE